LKKVDKTKFSFATDFTLPYYDFSEVEVEVNKRKAFVDQIVERDGVFTYTFPRTPAEITDTESVELRKCGGLGRRLTCCLIRK